jgi:thymidylate synthase ThyX
MTITANIICDSVWDDRRITTMQLRYPRIIHAEFMTHRTFSRNASSSRAIPIDRMISDVENDPFVPNYWGKNQKGMQARDQMSVQDATHAKSVWIEAVKYALESARCLSRLGSHKQLTNRLLEPFAHINTVVTATDWNNFFTLRRHADAQPEIKVLADAMWNQMGISVPTERDHHFPYTTWEDEDFLTDDGFRSRELISAARCARVSYRTHEGRISLAQEDLQLATSLLHDLHLSPFEHPAYAASGRHANFNGWKSIRHAL